MALYSNILSDTIFPSFVYSCEPDLDLKEFKKEIYQLQEEKGNIQRSNCGGYHSPLFDSKKESEFKDYKNLHNLSLITKEFTQHVINEENLMCTVSHFQFWVNINKLYHYNAFHNHGNTTDLIAIYYITIPKNSGRLVFMRNDGSQYSPLYGSREDLRKFIIEGQKGRLYILPAHMWHFVEASQSDKDRISISFNITVKI